MTMADILKAENHCPVCIQDRIFMQHHLDFDFKVDVGDHVGHCPCTPDLLPYQLKSGMAHHPKCKMSEKTCPECGHLVTAHNTTLAHCATRLTSWDNCPCTRTYESLVGFKYCPCNEWGSGVPIEHQHPYVHHFNCDGTGKLKTETQVETEMETELQLLVIDMGDSCVVRVEKCDKGAIADALHVEGLRPIVLTPEPLIHRCTFTELRSAIDGERPSPRIERNESNYVVLDEDLTAFMSATEYNTLTKINGKPLPIWEGGVWKKLLASDSKVGIDIGANVSVWRYTR